HALRSGGTIVGRRFAWLCRIACLIASAGAEGNSDHNSAMVPVTNGVATLVPSTNMACPCEPRLVIPTPGAARTRAPMDEPRFEDPHGRPSRSHAVTGITQA